MCVSVLVSLKIQPVGVWQETGVFRKRFLFSQVCHPLDRSVKLQDDKDITKPKKKAGFLQPRNTKSFSALAQVQQDFVHARPYFLFLE